MLQILSQFLLPTLLIVAAASDAKSFRIPNWLTMLTAVLFFPMALATAMPMQEFVMHLVSGVVLFFAGFVFFQFGIFGGGDAKLMAAAGLWFGTAKTLPFLAMTALAGGVLALVIGLWAMFMLNWEIQSGSRGLAGKLGQFKPNIPYGVAFALGGILAFKDTWWMTGVA